MLSANSFTSYSLRTLPHGPAVARILAASIHAVEPGTAVERFVQRSGNVLLVDGRQYDLARFRRVYLLGIGKASLGMSATLTDILGKRLHAGLVITKHAPARAEIPFPILEGGHPIPDGKSLEAGRQVLEFVSALTPQDLLVCLVSGGGSALVAAPLEGIPLEDLQALTSTLLRSGASIDEINSLRRRLDQLKGGGLVRLSNGAAVASLILSDVIGDPLEAIASGLTAPDPTSKRAALAILGKYALGGKIPASIQNALQQSRDTPKPADPIFDRVQNVIVGNNLVAVQAALQQAEAEGLRAQILNTDLHGEARLVGEELAHFLRNARNAVAPQCFVAGGETTVTLRGNGKGGRNTELALSAVRQLADVPGALLATLATDGEDGTTAAAGAVVTGETLQRAARLGMDPLDYLVRNDSFTFFEPLDDLLRPGSTGTNVNDLVVMVV